MIVGMLLGWAVNELTNTPRHLRLHVIACTGFANLNRCAAQPGGVWVVVRRFVE